MTEETPTPAVETPKISAESLKAENDALEIELNRRDAILARQAISGRGTISPPQETPEQLREKLADQEVDKIVKKFR